MTNGAIITFKNKSDKSKQLQKINKINIEGFKLYETKILNQIQIFCRIQVRSKKKITDLSYFNIKNIFFYERKNNLLKKRNKNIINFLNKVSFIKTTSRHVPNGYLFYKNFVINKNKIENIKIYSLVKNFFNP